MKKRVMVLLAAFALVFASAPFTCALTLDQVGSRITAAVTPEDIRSRPVEFVLLFLFIFCALVAIAAVFHVTSKHKNRQLRTMEEMLAKDTEINELNKRSQRIISSAPLAFMLTKDDVITEINSYAEKYFGLQVGDRYISAFADESAHNEIVAALDSFGFFQSTVNTLITANGELSHFIISGSTVDGKDGVCHANWALDIEDLERGKDKIRRAQKDLEKLIFALPSPVLLLDTETVDIIYCNQCFINLFGFDSIDDVVGLSYYDMFYETQPDGTNTKELIDDTISQLLETTGICTRERVYKLTDGSIIEAYATSGTIMFNQRPTILVIVRDITAEKEQSEMLRCIAEKEKESNQMKSRFLVNMSHEIRTPMNAIIGLSEIAMRKTQDVESAETLAKINNSAKILLTIINDILDFSKIEAEKLDLSNEDFELQEVLSNAMMVSRQHIGDKPVKMLLNVAPDVPCRVSGDKTRCWQVLKNFFDNSAKFTLKGTIKCEIYLVGHEQDKTVIGFTIKDTGIGVSKANLERIFVPFEQFGNASHTKRSGTGLGMPIAKQLIELMGGSIEIESALDVGTTVKFTLPFGLPENRVTFERCVKFPKARVLLCEDNYINQEVALGMLEAHGIKAVIAENGREALELLEKQEFDLVLMDILMPEMDGHEATVHIRGSGKPYKDIPILALTANVMQEEIEKCMYEGMNGHVPKPIEFYKLQKNLIKWLPAELAEYVK